MSPAAGNPLLEVRPLAADRRVLAVPGHDDRLGPEASEQAAVDRLDDLAEVRLGARGGARTPGEERVAREQDRRALEREAHRAGRVAGRGDRAQAEAADGEHRVVLEHEVVGGEPGSVRGGHRDLVARVAKLRHGLDVVPVAVGLDDGAHPERAAHLEEAAVLFRRADEERLARRLAPHDEHVVVARPDDEAVDGDLGVLGVEGHAAPYPRGPATPSGAPPSAPLNTIGSLRPRSASTFRRDVGARRRRPDVQSHGARAWRTPAEAPVGGRMARGRSRRGLLLVLASWIAGTGLACVAPGAGASGGDYLVVAGNGATTPLASATGSGALGTGLSQPGAVTADPSGNLVVADTGNSLVEVVAESPTNPGYLLPAGTTWTPGDVYLLAGGGSQAPSAAGTVASATRLAAPGALAVDAAGDVLVADTGDHEVEVLAESATNPGYLVPGGAWVRGELYVVAGGGSTALGATPVVATAARLVAPAGLAIDASGDVVISDGGTNLVSVLALGASEPGYPVAGGSWTPGDLYLLAGSGAATPTLAGAPARSVALSHPEGVAVDPAGDVLVADTDDGAIEVLAVSAADPGYVLGSGATWTPGDLYVLAGAGSSAPSPGGSPAAATLLNLPQGVGVDPEGDVLVADTDDGAIEVLAVSAADPGYVLGSGATWTPGDLYVLAGAGSSAPSPGGSPAAATLLNLPQGVGVDPEGDVLVADTDDGAIEVLAVSAANPGYVLGPGATWTPGDLYVLAGAGSSAPSPGGSPAAATLLNLPQGVGVDPEGDVLVADTDDGEIEVLAVSAANPGYVLGPGATWTPGECYVVAGGGAAAPSPAGSPAGAVALRQPDSLAGLASGAVAVADTGRSLVELLLLPPSAPPLTASSAGDASAALAWGAPARDGGSAPTGYVVRATPAGSSTPAVTEDLPATARAATIGGLVDGVSYLVSVAATNAAGTGPAAGARVVPEAPPTPGTSGAPGAGASSGAAGSPGAEGPPSAGSAPAPGVARSGAPGERRPRPTVRVGAPVLEAAGRLLGPQLHCDGATCRGAVEVTFERRVRVRLGAAATEALETTVVAVARFALAPGATRRVGLRLTAAGRRLLRGRRRVVATETVAVRGGRRAVRRVLLVARRRRAPRGSARRRHDLGILGAPEKGGGPTER